MICGGGYIALEVAAGIKSYAPELDVLVLMRGSHLLDKLFPSDISDFYMKELAQKGVKFARGYDIHGKFLLS